MDPCNYSTPCNYSLSVCCSGVMSDDEYASFVSVSDSDGMLNLRNHKVLLVMMSVYLPTVLTT